MRAQGWLLRLRYMTGGYAEAATKLELTPYVVYVQKLARLMRACTPTPCTDLVRFYLHAEHEADAFDSPTLDALLQLYEMRALVLLLDGVDEAADLKEIVEDCVCGELVPQGHPIVVTSRPEGVRLRLYRRDFVILNLEALTEEQQRAAIKMQLKESAFFNHLSAFSGIRQAHDALYATEAFPLEADRASLEQMDLKDHFRLGGDPEAAYDPAMRTRSVRDGFIGRRDGAPLSSYLSELSTRLLTPETLRRLDGLLAGLPEAPTDREVEATVVGGLGVTEVPDRRLCARLAKLVIKRRVRGSAGAGALCSAADLWPEIVARTDEVYELAEALQDRFAYALRAVMRGIGEDPDRRMGAAKACVLGALKDPIRLHEKAMDDYAGRFDDGVLPEACVVDVVRARAIFNDAARFRKMAGALSSGQRFAVDGEVLRLELIRGKNKFRNLEPTHFRAIDFHLCLHVERADGSHLRLFCEVQVHHFLILKLNTDRLAEQHYEFFRSHLTNYENDLGASLSFMLETRIKVFEEVGLHVRTRHPVPTPADSRPIWHRWAARRYCSRY